MKIFYNGESNTLSPEERVCRVVEESLQAVPFEKIYDETNAHGFVSKQKLKNILSTLLKKERINIKRYFMTYSEKPKIRTVIAEIYFTEEEQVVRYEENILPKLKLEMKESLRG